jgi:hypothetical protein
MNHHELELFRQLAEAYRTLREAYHHDMHRETPAKNDLQRQADTALAVYPALATPAYERSPLS